MFDLEQKRVRNALNLISKLKSGQPNSKNQIVGLPVRIQSNGLAMAGLYLLEKGFPMLADGIRDHLRGDGESKEYFLSLATDYDALELQALTREAQLFAGWLKRIARVELRDDSEEVVHESNASAE